jgi:predicted transposase YbfD/YdcC
LTTGKFRTETVYRVTSLSRKKGDPARALSTATLGASKNGLHVRHVAFDEDRCRIRKLAGAQVMASLRNMAISL